MWIHLLTLRLIDGAGGTSGSSGTSATTNANDTSSAAGKTTIVGSLARTNTNDTSAASGTTTVTGTSARTNANDTATASGTAGAPTGTAACTNNNDTCSAQGSTPSLAGSGAPGGMLPYVAYINGKRVIGNYWQIKALVEELAEEEAEKVVVQDKPAKRIRIVVEAGKPVTRAEPTREAVAEVREVQTDIRQAYSAAYAKAKLKLEEEEEETMMMLL